MEFMKDYSTLDKIRLGIPLLLLFLLILSLILGDSGVTIYLEGALYVGLGFLAGFEFFKGCKSRGLFYLIVLIMNYTL